MTPSGVLPETGVLCGHEGVLGFTARQAEAFDQLSIEPKDFVGAGERVVVPFRLSGRARHTGIPVEFSLVHVGTFRDGKVARIDVYATKAEALEAAGLGE